MGTTRLAITGIAFASVAAAGWGAARHLGGSEPLLVDESFSPTMSSEAATEKQIAFYTAAAERDPYGAISRAELAGLYLQRAREVGGLEEYHRAEAYARESVGLRGFRNAKGHRMLAASLLARHEFAAAQEAAAELVRLWPEEPSHRSLLGQIQLELGYYDAAAATFEALETNEAQLSVAPRLAMWAHVRGDDGEAERLYRLGLQRAQHRTDLPAEQRSWHFLMLGEHLASAGGFEEAERSFAEGLAIEPGDFRIVGALVRLEARRGAWERALKYGEVLGDAADLQTLGVLGDAHLARGDTAAAEGYYERLERDAAESPEPFNRQLYAFLLDHDRRVDEVLELVREEIARRPDVLGWDLLGWALLKSGDPAGAAAASRKALALGTREPLFHFHAGLAELALGREDQAREHMAAALEINPHFHHRFAGQARRVLAGQEGGEARP